jgi:predicted nucleic acid-binding protein
MPFVVDASVTMAWSFDDENHPVAASALSRIRDDEAFAPSLWWFEVRNALAMGERRGRTSEQKTAEVLLHLAELSVSIDEQPDEKAIFRLARKRRLTFYDASYLELAQRRNFALATLDSAISRAAKAEGVEMIG